MSSADGTENITDTPLALSILDGTDLFGTTFFFQPVTTYVRRRAPSSPRHARGLNVSLFLQPCTWPRSAPLLGLYGGWQAGKTLRIPAPPALFRRCDLAQIPDGVVRGVTSVPWRSAAHWQPASLLG